MQNTRMLEQFGVDLVERAERAEPVVGRRQEIETVLQILSRRQKNNPALMGVGKTAIVEGVAQYIAEGRVPENLRGKRLFALDMASLLAGTKYRGEFEERVRDLLAEVQRAQNVILFIDEMHTLVGAGAAEGAIDAANLLKPALGRGRVQLIGATTLDEYRKSIEADSALERRFRPVQVREPTQEETLEILRGVRPALEAHHRLPIADGALRAAVELSCRYLSDKFLPDKAVDLLDEGAALARLAQATDERSLLRRLRGTPPARCVTEADVAAVVSSRTGIPLGELSGGERRRLLTLEQTLSGEIIGQDEAVRAVAQAVRRGRSGLAEGKRPIASMLFTGPTGVGKTALCKALARALYGSERAMVRLDMSEYMEKHAVSRLLGAPPGYVGHGEGGELTERVRRQPYSLVLLDEIEKAHPDLCGILLQVMDDGALTDADGRRVDFRNTLLVMTSNLGAQCPAAGFGERTRDSRLRALREHFAPEFLGRLDCIAAFSPLGEEALAKIARLQLDALQARAEKRGLTVTANDSAARTLAARCAGGRGGARELRRLIQNEVEAPLADALFASERHPPVRVSGSQTTLRLVCD